MIKRVLAKTKNWYARYERPISSLSLVGGFVFNAVTLKRVDMLWENIWIFGHIILVGIFIVLVHVKENKNKDEGNPDKAHFWFVNILQYYFGGTLSTFLVFYFRSTDIWATWPFLLILVLAFVANESFKRNYVRLSFQISLFFLSVYSFAIFLVPIIMHEISAKVFLISGLASLIFIFIFSAILFRYAKRKTAKSKQTIFISVLSIFALINIFYFTNLMPPIPLALKDAGVYHSIVRNQAGDYDVTYEDYGWQEFFKLCPDYKKTDGSPIYFYSAIFSTKDLNLKIVHEWQYYDLNKKKWIADQAIGLLVIGGRDDGFRTYSKRTSLNPGKWRVIVKTERGQTIGRFRFNLLPVLSEPILLHKTLK